MPTRSVVGMLLAVMLLWGQYACAADEAVPPASRELAIYEALRRGAVALAPQAQVPAAVTLDRWAQALVVESSFAQRPEITITDRCDFTKYPGQRARNIVINEVPLWDDLLCQGRVTLYPTGTALWEYWVGVGQTDYDTLDTEEFVNKITYDALPRGKQWRGQYLQNGSWVLWMPRTGPITFPLPQPPDMTLDSVTCSLAAASFNDEDRLILRLTADPEGQQVIAERELTKSDCRAPIQFEGDVSAARYVVLNCRVPSAGAIFPQDWKIEARYRFDPERLPLFQPGRNQVMISTDPQGSPLMNVAIRLKDAPVFESFEDPQWQQPPYQPQEGDSFQGDHHVTLSMPGRSLVLSPKPGEQFIDLSAFARIRLAARIKAERHGYIYVYLDYQDPETGENKRSQFRRLIAAGKGIGAWRLYETGIDSKAETLSEDAKRQITRIRITPTGGWDKAEPKPVEIDAVEFLRARPHQPPPADQEEFQAQFREVALEKLQRAQQIQFQIPDEIPDVRQGVYSGAFMGGSTSVQVAAWAGISRADAWRVIFQDQLDLGFNAVFLTNWAGPGTEKFNEALDIAEEMGLRLYYQGPYFWRSSSGNAANTEESLAYYERTIKPHLEAQLPRIADRWGLLAWEVSEEEPPRFVDCVKPQFELMRQIDPHHPIVIVWNSKQSLWYAAEQLKPRVTAFDIYPYMGGWKWSLSRGYMTGLMQQLTDAARAADGVAWVVGQTYGYRVVAAGRNYWERRPQSGPEIALQLWSAAALGCRGFFFYPYQPMRHPVEYIKRNGGTWCDISPPFFAENEAREVLRRTLGQFMQAEAFLVEGEYLGRSVYQDGSPLLIAHYKFRGYDCFRIVNGDRDNPHRLETNPLPELAQPWYFDMLTGRKTQDVAELPEIPPGEGMMLAVSASDDFDTVDMTR